MSGAPANGPKIAGAADPLGDAVRSLFSDLRHAGDEGALRAGVPGNGVQRLCGEAGRAAQGTHVRFSLWMVGERVQQARYRAYGCPYTLACCEWLARQLSGAPLPPPSAAAPPADVLTAMLGTPPNWAAALAIPPARLGRLLIIEDALRAALAGYPGAVAAPHDERLAAHPTADDESMTKPG